MTFDKREEFMGIMDNEGHNPIGFGNVQGALPMQADPDPRAALIEARAEIERLRARLHEIEAQSIATTEPDYVAVPAKLIYEQK